MQTRVARGVVVDAVAVGCSSALLRRGDRRGVDLLGRRFVSSSIERFLLLLLDIMKRTLLMISLVRVAISSINEQG